MLRGIITGTGRCGTKYVAKLLESHGYSCGHEKYFGNTIVKNDNEYDSSLNAAPFLKYYKHIPKIHLIRHPNLVINSMYRTYFMMRVPDGYQSITKYCKLEKPPSQLFDRYIDYYIKWNLLIDAWATDRHRIDMDPDYKLFHKLGIPYRPDVPKLPKNINHKPQGNTRSPRKIDVYEYLPENHALFFLLKRYGYD